MKIFDGFVLSILLCLGCTPSIHHYEVKCENGVCELVPHEKDHISKYNIIDYTEEGIPIYGPQP
jgi:hypothetical protein